MIRASCPECQTRYRVQAEFAGRMAKCPKCGAEFVVPSEERPENELAANVAAEIPEGKDAFVPIPDWVQKPSFPIEAGRDD